MDVALEMKRVMSYCQRRVTIFATVKGLLFRTQELKLYVLIDMCSLVMNICSCDVIKYYYKTLNNICLHTYVVF